MTCSSAKVACGAPGARYAPVPTRFVSTPYATTSWAAQRYGPTVRMAAMPSTLPSEKPPVSIRSRARIPVSRPSFVAPAVTSRIAGGRRIAHPEVLVSGELDPDRPAQEQGRACRERIGDQQLAAEPAAQASRR